MNDPEWICVRKKICIVRIGALRTFGPSSFQGVEGVEGVEIDCSVEGEVEKLGQYGSQGHVYGSQGHVWCPETAIVQLETPLGKTRLLGVGRIHRENIDLFYQVMGSSQN